MDATVHRQMADNLSKTHRNDTASHIATVLNKLNRMIKRLIRKRGEPPYKRFSAYRTFCRGRDRKETGSGAARVQIESRTAGREHAPYPLLT